MKKLCMKKHVYLSLLSLSLLGAACQPGLVSPTPSTPPSATASASARVLTITSETNDPKLPKILVPGLELKVFAGSGKAGYKDGPALEAEFRSLGIMTKDNSNNIYVSDYRDVRIRKINAEGKVSTLIGNGQRVPNGKTGLFTETEFYTIGYLTYKNPNQLLVSDGGDIVALDLDAKQSKLLTAHSSRVTPYRDFIKESSQLPLIFNSEIYAMTIHNNTIYLGLNSEIWTLTDTNGLYKFERYAGNAAVNPVGGSIDDARRNFKDGPPDDSKFNRPASMVFDHTGNMYVADALNHRIRKIEAGTRNVSTLAGYSLPDPSTTIDQNFIGGFKDEELQTAQFNFPYLIQFTDTEELLIYDSGNNALRIIIQDQVRTLVQNCHCGGLLKDGSTLYISDDQNLQIYTLDLSQLEKLKPKILKQEKTAS